MLSTGLVVAAVAFVAGAFAAVVVGLIVAAVRWVWRVLPECEP